MTAGLPRIRTLSSRPAIREAVAAAARALEPAPTVRPLPPGEEPEAGALLLVDIADPTLAPGVLRRHLEGVARAVALVESTWADRLGEALAGDWFDYLFHPLNVAELGLVWRRHLSSDAAPGLSLDVDEDGTIRLVCPSRVSYQRPAVERIVDACRHLAALDEDAAFRLRVAVGEAVANAILYGNREDPSRVVKIAADANPESVVVRVADEGAGFDPGAIPDPTDPDVLERSRGRGLFLLRSLMDEVRHNEAGNEVTLVLRGRPDLLHRVRPLLGEYAGLTGLRYRLVLRRPDGEEVLHEGAPAVGRADGLRTSRRQIGPQALEISFVTAGRRGGPAPERAAEFLLSLVTAIIEAEGARERFVERRIRRERVLAELEVARDLQLRLLPSTGAFDDVVEVAARCEPALSLGGDFYFLARTPGDRLGVMLGDVSSHGPSAALIMALTLSAAAVVTHDAETPGEVLYAMQRQLLSALESTEMYMTLFYALLDRGEARLRYASAGHPFAFRAAEGRLHRLEALDPPIGMTAPARYAETDLAWRAAEDILLLFTDGLAEGLDDPSEGPRARLEAVLRSGEASPVRLVETLFEHADPARADDRTAIAVRTR
ncbi:MAG: PP2C family protein-serine/threonine phosphatase [Gemmatimonadota bacterium]